MAALSRKDAVRKVEVGANGVGRALAALQVLADKLGAIGVACECQDELAGLGGALLGLEDAVGVVTPMSLFQ